MGILNLSVIILYEDVTPNESTPRRVRTNDQEEKGSVSTAKDRCGCIYSLGLHSKGRYHRSLTDLPYLTFEENYIMLSWLYSADLLQGVGSLFSLTICSRLTSEIPLIFMLIPILTASLAKRGERGAGFRES